MALKTMNPNDLKVDYAKWQLRSATDNKHIDWLADRMRTSGFSRDHPILVNKDLFVWDGFHRRAAAQRAGLDKVYVKVEDADDIVLMAKGIEENMKQGKHLEYPKDFKVAAAKLASMGMNTTEIANTLWPVPREKWRSHPNRGPKHPKYSTVGNWLGHKSTSDVSGSAVRSWARPIMREAGYPQTPDEAAAVLRAHFTAEQLDDQLLRFEDLITGEREVRTPDWAVCQEHSGPGTPVLFISDIHGGEVVSKEELGGRNEYNWEIMCQRLDAAFKTTVELLTVHLARPQYDGIYLVLGGDIVTGEIHEELKETNAMPLLECTLELSDILAGHALRLADEFGKVHLVGVPGNHGRLEKKPRAKGFTRNNADYHTYRQMQRMLQRDERFTFYFPLSGEARFNVNGRRFKLIHGDQFRGGDGMVGPMGPILRGAKKLHSSAAVFGGEEAFDTLMLGHFHQLSMSPQVLVNGSLKGYDEYAARNCFQFERPAQLLFTVHPEHGITWFVPVYV